MQQKNIKLLKNIYNNEDIWVIASGPSMNYIQPEFFENKITIGINKVCKKFNCDYIVAKDGKCFKELEQHTDSNTKIILSKHESGNLFQNLNSVNFDHYIFEHPSKPNEEPQLGCIEKNSDKIVVSYSTITSALHLSAYMGAKNIMICGHDCGTIDGESNINNYYNKNEFTKQKSDWYIQWLSKIENHTVLVADKIRQSFGCNIHSLNPFINFNLEGHNYVPSNKGHFLQRELR